MSEEQLRLDDFEPVLEEHSSDEISPGYKKTGVLVIPQDWSTVFLGEKTVKVGSGITPTGGIRVYKESGRPFLRSQNIEWGYINLDDIAFIDEQTHQSFIGTEIRESDVLLNITGASIGRSAVADKRVEGGNVNQHVCIIRPQCSVLDSVFLKNFLLSELGQRQIDSFQAGGNRQGLNFNQIRSFVIPLPKLSEQAAIAEVLTDVDNLIESLDNLISKKQAIKKSTMQQLLTGRTRLPGFKEEWNHTKLGEVLKVCHGRNQRGIAKVDGRYPILASGGEIGRTDHSLHDGPSVLIGRKGTIDQPQFISSPFWTVDTLFYTSLSSYAFAKFIYYKFCLIPWKIYNEASGVPSLNAHTIEQIEITIPSIEEQQAISSILLDMDAEIEALERQRDKMKQIKQVMMQQLLTGRIRLLDKEAV